MKVILPKIKISNVARFFIILSLFFIPSFGVAETILNTTNESIRLIVTPQNPKPLDKITVSIESSLVDLSDATITWQLNGRTMEEGKDMRVWNTTLGPNSTATNIKVLINSREYGIIAKEITLRLGEIDLIYEAETYTPPFYKGRALASAQSIVKAIAVPNLQNRGGQIPSRDIVFTWKRNGEVDAANSGRGKSTYRFSVGNLPSNSPIVEVTASSLDGSIVAYGSLIVPHEKPEIIFYEENALLGVELQRALGDIFIMKQPETTLVAYPYFFSAKAKDSRDLNFTWVINSEEVTPIGNSVAKITLRKPEGSGNSYVSLNIDHARQIFQTSNSGVNFEYGN